MQRVLERARTRLRFSSAAERLFSAVSPERAVALLALTLTLGLTAILASPVLSPESSLVVGQPSPKDVDAPRSISYVSAVLTEREANRAAEAVATQFQPTDPVVAGRQAKRAHDVLSHIALVRSNPHATIEEKQASLSPIPELSGQLPEQLRRLVELDDETWLVAEREVPIVVAQTLRQPVRPDTLAIARASVVANVDRDLDPSTAQLVAEIAGAFIVPNTSVDDEKTEQARQLAREAAPPVERSVAAGETIVRAGDIVEAEDIEAMKQLGLVSRTLRWRDVVALGALVLALVASAAGVLERLRPRAWRQPRPLGLTVLLLLIFALGARMIVPGHVVLAYAYPAAAVAMTLTVLFGPETGAMSALVLAMVMGLLAGSGLELTLYVLIGSMAGTVYLSRVESLTAFLRAGTALFGANVAVILAFRTPGPTPDLRAVTELAGAALAHAALATGLAILGVMATGLLLGITTSIQLLELARPDHPVLRELQTKAPGTYQHSIVLANIAEAAAARIGADALLLRVGAYYHDIGKSLRPYFFVENQMGRANPHDGLDPYTSARIICDHVKAGIELARQHSLPEVIIDFIPQHHGTSRIEYFYHRAVKQYGEGAVDEAQFRYPGPRPQSREAAIIMLADGAEAAVRAAEAESVASIDEVVRGIFARRLTSGQLDDSNLTLRDLSRIRAAFVAVLQSMYHPRIKYPEDIAAPAGDGQHAPASP